MQTEIGAYEAKTTLPEILRRVAEGETFTITNRGKPVADLIPSKSSDKQKVDAAISSILGFKKKPVSTDDFEELRTSGRK